MEDSRRRDEAAHYSADGDAGATKRGKDTLKNEQERARLTLRIAHLGGGSEPMGFFKQIKDLKETVAAAPGMIEEAQKMQANAQAMAAQQQAAAAGYMAQANAAAMGVVPGMAPGAAPAGAPVGPDFEPVSGVSLELFAEVSKGLAAYNYDQSKAVEIAASKGVSAEAWQAAIDTWNARMKSNPAVAQRFNALYTGRA